MTTVEQARLIASRPFAAWMARVPPDGGLEIHRDSPHGDIRVAVLLACIWFECTEYGVDRNRITYSRKDLSTEQ
jgi:hypothetical protein